MTLEAKESAQIGQSLLDGHLEDSNIRVVGISNHTVRTSITTRWVAERVKGVRSDVKIVVGGVNATFMSRELLLECDAIDFILRGYGQAGLRSLLTAIAAKEPVAAPGLSLRKDGVDQEPAADRR